MAGLFQPTITSTSSLPAVPTGVKASSAPVAEAALEGIGDFVNIAKRENQKGILSEFNNRIEKIKQAADTSKGFSKDKYRLEISRTIADFKESAPSLASEFDKLSGKAGTLIPKTAFEKGFEETQKKLASLIPMLGEEGAIEFLTLEAEEKKEELLMKKKEREGKAKASDYESYANKGISTDTSWFYNTLDSLIENNTDGLDKAVVGSLKLELDKKKQQRLSELRKAIADGANAKEIRIVIEKTEKQYEDMKKSLNDLDSYSIISSRTGTLESQDKMAARELFPVASILAQIDRPTAGLVVSSVLKGNSVIVDTFKKNNPDLFSDREDYNKKLVSGMNKIFSSLQEQDSGVKLSEGESAAVSAKIATSPEIVEGIARASESVKEGDKQLMLSLVKKIHSTDPQSLVGYRNPSFKAKLRENYEKYGWMAEAGIQGTISAVFSSYFMAEGNLPNDIKIYTGSSKKQIGNLSSLIPLNDLIIEGTNLSFEQKLWIKEAYRTIEANPAILRNIENKLNISEGSLSTSEYLTMVFNSKDPASSIKAREDRLENKSKGSDAGKKVNELLGINTETPLIGRDGDPDKPKNIIGLEQKLLDNLRRYGTEKEKEMVKEVEAAKTRGEVDSIYSKYNYLKDSSNNVNIENTPPKKGKEVQAIPPDIEDDVFNALEDSTPSEISKFRKALREAKNATEKSEVYAAFIDGAFREAR